MEVLFNKEGTPLAFSSDRIFGMTQARQSPVAEDPRDTFTVRDREFVSWGPANRYPDEACRVIGTTGVLSTAINFKTRLCTGQGVTADGPGADAANRWLQGYQCRKYLAETFRDLFKLGNAFPIVYFDREGRAAALVSRDARHCRMSVDKRWLCVYADYGRTLPSDGEGDIIRLLDEDDPFGHLEALRLSGKLGTCPVAFPRLKNLGSNRDYYALPDWDAAWKSGWVDVAHKIPQFLARSYANAMTLMWHVQIPASYWEEKFPQKNYQTAAERQKAVNEFMDRMEHNLCGQENVSKTLFTDYAAGNGRSEEKWIIERLANEIDAKERLSTSAAANSEILFSMMLNPSVLGAGMPGGAYAGNAGSGSDIRESYLVSLIGVWLEKQQALDPVRLMFKHNNIDVSLSWKDTILTTLNTGQSQKTVSS